MAKKVASSPVRMSASGASNPTGYRYPYEITSLGARVGHPLPEQDHLAQVVSAVDGVWVFGQCI